MATSAKENRETGESALTEKQKAVIAELPGTSRTIADKLGTSTSAVRHRVERVNGSFPDQDPIFRDEDGLYVWDSEKPLHRMSTHHQGSITRAANNFLTDDEAGIKSILENSQPATAQQNPRPSNEDMVCFLTDLHMGDRVTDDKGREIYNMDIAEERVHEMAEETLRIKRERDQIQDFDTCHLVLGGDLATGEVIYANQWEDLDMVGATIKDQINRTSEAIMSIIKTLAEEFETLQVVGVPGNHGSSRASGSSKQANSDINIYSRLEFAVSHCEYDNIHFQFNDSTNYTNFYMRGGEVKSHLRHGENTQTHAGATAASKRDWRGWLNAHEFDISLRGHYHEAKLERVMGVPILMGGSPKGPSDFEESISEISSPGAVVFGVSDDRVLSWVEFIDF